jgi:hypothetical protein
MSSSPSSANTTSTTTPAPTALHHHNHHLTHHNKPANQASPTKTKLNVSSLDVENTTVEDRVNKRMRMSDSIDNLSNLAVTNNNIAVNAATEPLASPAHEVNFKIFNFFFFSVFF